MFATMDFRSLFDFLEKLQANNNKQWMDAHRGRYRSLRGDFILWLDQLDQAMAEWDPEYCPTPGKRAINRINNNLMFHPNKPVYKDHFAATLDRGPLRADFYIELGLENCLMAGGFWRPGPKALASIRQGIDYNGEELLAVLERPSFKRAFGGLYPDETLTQAPKGHAPDHPHIELLRHKTFAVEHRFAREELFKDNFREKVRSIYMEMLPFRRYLNQAVSV